MHVLAKCRGAGPMPPPLAAMNRGVAGLLLCCFLELEFALEPWLTVDVRKFLHDLELTVCLRLSDVDALRQMHVLLRSDLAPGPIEANAGLKRFTDLVDFEALGLFDGSFPEINPIIA